MKYVIYFKDANNKRIYAKRPNIGDTTAYTDDRDKAFRFNDRATAEAVAQMLQYEDELFEDRYIEEVIR